MYIQCCYLNEIITFAYPRIVEKVLFLRQTFKMEIWIDLHVLRSPEFEK